MSKNRRPGRRERWWPRMTFRDLADTSFEDRERGPEAEARHRAYVQNAYATLSPARELMRYGAWSGLQVGAAALAVETAFLLALLAVARLVEEAGLSNMYGQTPLSGTFFEPLWPIMLSLPALPLLTVAGALAALARREGNRRRRALDRYFNPVSTRLDFVTFLVLIFITLSALAYAARLFTQSDPTGLLTLILCAGGLIAWPCHRLWLIWYLPLLSQHSSVRLEEITALIQPQL